LIRKIPVDLRDWVARDQPQTADHEHVHVNVDVNVHVGVISFFVRRG
jgi:hypothetical protein